ncbi:MAG TPA: tyrosine-type recombinase/integrase [Chloroflexota bacterium]
MPARQVAIGEACGLRCRDLDPFGETLTVVQQIAHNATRPAPVKGKRAVTLPISPDLVAWLVEHRRAEAARGRPCAPDDLLFVDARKKPETPVTYGKAWPALRKLTALAGLPVSGASHRRRHTAAMLSLDVGTPLPVIQRVLRHTSLATTATYVGHESPRRAREDARAVAERLRLRDAVRGTKADQAAFRVRKHAKKAPAS